LGGSREQQELLYGRGEAKQEGTGPRAVASQKTVTRQELLVDASEGEGELASGAGSGS
jgi:hypothetical protein